MVYRPSNREDYCDIVDKEFVRIRGDIYLTSLTKLGHRGIMNHRIGPRLKRSVVG